MAITGAIQKRRCRKLRLSALLLAGGLWSGALAAQQSPQPDPAPQAPTPTLNDAEFEKALPPLEQVASPPEAPAAPAPPAPELEQPLPPLATFESTPAPTIAAEAGDQARQIPYTVQVEGLKPLGLEARFRELSALLHDGKKAANATQISARADEDKAMAERLMRSEGYLDAAAIATIPPSSDPAASVPVTITATPGTRFKLGTITLTGAAPEPTILARDALRLKTGDPIAAGPIEEAEARVALRLPEQGYPFVKLGQHDILVDGATATGDYTLPLEAGHKSRFGKLTTAGDQVFTVQHLNVFPRFDPGEIYDARKVDDMRQALIGTGILSTVSVEPVPTGEIQPDGTEIVDLLVRQTRGPARTLSATGGYGTGEGIKLTGSWEHRNLFPPEGALILTALAGTQQQSVSTTFRRSDAGKRDRTFEASTTVSRQRFDAYDAQSVTLAAGISRQSTPIWQKRWTYAIGAELTATRETPFVPTDLSRPNSTYFIAALPLQLGYDTSNSLLDPTRGFRVNGKISPEVQKQSGGGFDKYVSMLLETSTYRPITDSLVLAGRVRVGSIVGAARDDIAPSRRLYSGGGGSVRGFGYQQLGPKDDNNDPIGGRSLTEFAVEARYRFGNYGIVPFFDGGRVGESSTPSISGMRYGVGIGVRYYTNFGPFRIDVATPLGRKPGESKLGVYISIGQAF
jgi:translocation and assembly module TamA